MNEICRNKTENEKKKKFKNSGIKNWRNFGKKFYGDSQFKNVIPLDIYITILHSKALFQD